MFKLKALLLHFISDTILKLNFFVVRVITDLFVDDSQQLLNRLL